MAADAVAHIAAFARILSSTQTAGLHQWDATSFDRACAWATTIKQLIEKAEGESREQLHNAISTQLNGIRLPLAADEAALSVDQLALGPRLVCNAVLASPHLHSHPQRQKIVVLVLKTLRHKDQSTSDRSSSEEPVSGDLFMKRITANRSREQIHSVAQQVASSFKRTRVQIHSHILEIPSLKSYELSRRCLHLKSLGETLQANSRVAKALDTDKYRELLERIEQQVQTGDRDVLEVIVWSIVGQSSHLTPEVQSDIILLLEKRVAAMQTPALLRLLEPWVAALFARQSSEFASTYIPALVHHSILYLDKEERHTRLGSLALQGSDVAVLLESELSQLDPVSSGQLFS